jgi:hypothetical protein
LPTAVVKGLTTLAIDAGLKMNTKKTRAMSSAETEIKLNGEEVECLSIIHT